MQKAQDSEICGSVESHQLLAVLEYRDNEGSRQPQCVLNVCGGQRCAPAEEAKRGFCNSWQALWRVVDAKSFT
ncbi:hypothetical protein DPEC_G00013260 [Dallia pectoralis]|uniref:Uncharacterized protein n=1 Tax=Dallia pectoralis TaxID=75939 RepID=A0ACC2HLZ6_DALPE|nr:hypothetical protein DPEC_G00013260 [Dallia pectoralis]